MKRLLVPLLATLLAAPPAWSDGAMDSPTRSRMIDAYLAYGQFKMGRHEQAMAIWQQLAAQGDADAAFQLGVIYEDGRGTPSDLERALHYYHQASDGGSRRAALRLAELYAQGAPGLPADPSLGECYRSLSTPSTAAERAC
ncbi:tetratricopeptide repeat protein [Billgrantia kenyensis]|uniref:Sel1 repeat family protein n=1 Tax=Billgrantia kenyensis TaxID=321266 RepID=A0A7V9VZJ6_9GAMM|nr:SEL1-like repeat protein [Halomonas kenyensis]MBA2778297.1 sel1 repeat family protein [Halomonas kenyensis]MCG6660604.1 sel1 repeat family protein [Halomonas kenyensis]